MGRARSRAAALAALVLSFTAPAAAHGPLPSATGLLGLSGEEVTLVRLSRGLAHRVPEGYRFLCPEAWGGDVTAPAAAMAGGSALVASEALFIVEPSGRVAPHPTQPGVGIALANSRDSVFGLFEREGAYELQRLTESTSELVRVLNEPFGALAASDSQLALLGWAGRTLVLQTLSLTGELRARVTWSAPHQVAYAELRVAAEQLYVSVWGRSAPWVTLGRVSERGYEPLREANTNIAGPVALADRTLVVLDGSLEALDEGPPIDGRGDYVTCLSSDVGEPYACVHGDVMRIDPAGLGAPLFEISSLLEPDYRALPEAARVDCTTRWLDLREHVATPAESNLDAEVEADAGVSDVSASDASAPGAGGATPAGCAVHRGTAHACWFFLITLVVITRRRGARLRAWCGSSRFNPRLQRRKAKD